MELQVNPTRMELRKALSRYEIARRGHRLLKDKCDEIMRIFLGVVGESKILREKTEKGLQEVYGNFSEARASSSPETLAEALVIPNREIGVDVGYKSVMSVNVPVFDAKFSAGEATDFNYGLVFTSGDLDTSLQGLSSLVEDMVKMAELEKTAELLAVEIERTRRRVNALEYILMPKYLETAKTIRMRLDENERGNTTRLMKIKDMMVKSARGEPTCGE